MLRIVPIVAALLAPPASANPEARVEVLGVGSVRLEHAAATCLTGLPQGEITMAAGNTRVPVFQDVARGLLEQPSEVRREYFRYHHDLDWPVAAADVSYVPPLNWTHPGVVASCEAAGAYWVREGIRLSTVCPADKSACKAQFTDEEWEIAKGALKLGRKDADPGRDAFFAHLNANDEALESWSNPLPFLDKACRWPQVASTESRFIDRSDLVAARRACLQVQVLVTHADALAPLDLPCDTDWRSVERDAPHLVAAPHTDLGLTADYADEQLQTLRDRLHRMDPSAARCGGDWAAIWRKQLVQVWRDAQTQAACADDGLRLADRVHLCPGLPEVSATRCDEGDAAACEQLATMHVEGHGVERDDTRATELLLRACGAPHLPACERLSARLPTITGWIDERLRAVPVTGPADDPATEPGRAALEEARGVVERYGPHLDEGWTRAQVQRLFEAALSARYPEFAAALLADFGEAVPGDWLASSEAALEALRSEVDAATSAASPAMPPRPRRTPRRRCARGPGR